MRSAVPALIAALFNPDPRIWSKAGQALCAIGPNPADVPALVHGLMARSGHVRFYSARALAKTSTPPIAALPALLDCLREEDDWPVVDSVWWALNVIGLPSVAPLAALLRQGDQRTRRRAAYCLMSGSVERLRQSIPPLLAALADDDERVRATALQSLARNARSYKGATGVLDAGWTEVPGAMSRSLTEANTDIRRAAARVLREFDIGPDEFPDG